MKESWRWYGPLDKITLSEILQTGASGIVTALHEIPYGEVWPCETIAKRKADILAAGLDWVVVESLPIHERIKRGDGDLSALFANYRQSMANLSQQAARACGSRHPKWRHWKSICWAVSKRAMRIRQRSSRLPKAGSRLHRTKVVHN